MDGGSGGPHAMNGGTGGGAVGGSAGETVHSMADANDQMWEKLFALSAMAEDSRAEWSEGPSAAAGGAGSKRRRTGDSDDSDEGEDAAVSARLGARLSMNENLRRAKQRRAQGKRLAKAEAKLLDLAAQKHSEMLNPRRLSVLREVGAVMLQEGAWIACRQELLVCIAEVCEVAGRDFIYTKGLTKGKEGTSTWICCLDDGLVFACACKHSSNCAFRCKAMWGTHPGHDDAGWVVTVLVTHDCKGTVSSAKKTSGVPGPLRVSSRSRVTHGGRDGGARGGGGAAGGGN